MPFNQNRQSRLFGPMQGPFGSQMPAFQSQPPAPMTMEPQDPAIVSGEPNQAPQFGPMTENLFGAQPQQGAPVNPGLRQAPKPQTNPMGDYRQPPKPRSMPMGGYRNPQMTQKGRLFGPMMGTMKKY